ncbi:hypothetical protein EXIGLDRAFT_757414 [Exidia glandulosa HHB12029]|uniref:Uncharacterized protein n=1 Tax=Exidia glandulosa HHB12029 TaxID=1314781 RepID=A0A165Z2L2_EXIGL|nr:hypothetical protein EXIGLDRAFT_757414 [Exidia glandulosa HHB12029]
MRASFARIACVLLLFLALANLVGAKNPGRPKKQKRAPSSERNVESQDEQDINMDMTTPGSEIDELQEDNPGRAPNTARVHFSPVNESASASDMPQPPTYPNTPESLGRISFALGQAPEGSKHYNRPSTAKERKSSSLEESQESLSRTWHPWYIFNNEDRRKRFFDMMSQLRTLLHDLSASTGATAITCIGRPESNPAKAGHFGELITSRSVARNKELEHNAQLIWEDFVEHIARPRRNEYDQYSKDAAEARREFDEAQEEYQAAAARLQEVERRSRAIKQEREDDTASGAEKVQRKRKWAVIDTEGRPRGATRRGAGRNLRSDNLGLGRVQAPRTRAHDRIPSADGSGVDTDNTNDALGPSAHRRRKGKERAPGERPHECSDSDDGPAEASSSIHRAQRGDGTLDLPIHGSTAQDDAVEVVSGTDEDEDADLREAAAASIRTNADEDRRRARQGQSSRTPVEALPDAVPHSSRPPDSRESSSRPRGSPMRAMDGGPPPRRFALSVEPPRLSDVLAGSLGRVSGLASTSQLRERRTAPPESVIPTSGTGTAPRTSMRPPSLPPPAIVPPLAPNSHPPSSRSVSISSQHNTTMLDAPGMSQAPHTQPPPSGRSVSPANARSGSDDAGERERDASALSDMSIPARPPSSAPAGSVAGDVPLSDIEETVLPRGVVEWLRARHVASDLVIDIEMIWFEHTTSSAILDALRVMRDALKFTDGDLKQLLRLLVIHRPPKL